MGIIYLWLFFVIAFYAVDIICSCLWNGYSGVGEWWRNEIKPRKRY
jgi:hypothetical protein